MYVCVCMYVFLILSLKSHLQFISQPDCVLLYIVKYQPQFFMLQLWFAFVFIVDVPVSVFQTTVINSNYILIRLEGHSPALPLLVDYKFCCFWCRNMTEG